DGIEIDVKELKVSTEREAHTKDYRLPGSIEVTVSKVCEGDDADLIACLVQHMRQGYAHSNDDTSLPAPLFFEAKVRDYMVRFAVSDAEIGEEDEDTTPPDQPPPTDGGEPIGDSDSAGLDFVTALVAQQPYSVKS